MPFGRPFPRRDDHVALDATRPRRLALGQFAFCNAVGPVAEILERHTAEFTREAVDHPFAGLPRRNAAHPGLLARLELAKGSRNGAGRFLAKLMAADAIDVVHAL